ncbi:MAG: RHS repeat-associated core domain-containing protein [Oscillospiraceae bacterium]
MKKSLWTRLLSLLLAVVLCVELLPAVGSAVSPSEDLEHTVEGTVEEPAEVAFEEASLRGERVKHFRMGDGSYVAVQYDVPVHHQDADGRWQDIDNTLEPVGQTYAVEDGSVAFAASLNGDAVFTADADEHRVQLFLDGDPDVLPSHDATLAAPEPTEAVALPEVTEETTEEPAEETETAASEEEPAAEMMVETGAAAEPEPAGPARSYHAAEAVVQEPFSLRSDDPFVPEKLSSSLLYPDVYDGVDLAYTLYGETIKETILLNKAQASYLFSFVLQTGDLTAEMQEDGSVLLLDEAGSPVYAIPAPYMLDAGGTYSDAVRYTLEELDRGSYRLLVDADAAWIEEEAQFPVAIDPTIVKISQSGSLSWAYVFSGRPDTSYPESTVRVGYTQHNGSGEYQAIAAVDKLPALPSGSMVTAAAIHALQSGFSNVSSDDFQYLYAHQLTIDKTGEQKYSDWIKTLTWNKIYANGTNHYKTATEDFIRLTSTNGYRSLDITRAARSWYSGGKCHAILLRSDCSASKRIVSSFQTGASYLTVTYRNDFGLESYYTYQTQSAGRAGTGYISDHMQRLTFVVPLLSSDSSVMPFGLSLVYNSGLSRESFGVQQKKNPNEPPDYTRDYRNMLLGSGWKLSAQQCVQSVRIGSDDAQTLYWVYTDADGTQHYFSKEGGGGAETDGVFRDEDGLGLKMTCQANPDSDTGHTNFTITDDNGNETFFRDGILTYTKDAYGNGIYYCYNGINFDTPDGKSWRPTNEVFNRLTSICRQNKDASSECLAKLIYDADGRLLRVGDEAGKETKFHYDNTADVRQLDYILCPDGTKLNYTYDTTGLNGAHDGEANYGIWYTYHTDGTIDQFYEFTLDGSTHVPGDTVKCWNGKNRSSYRAFGADQLAETEDDIRLEVVFDNWGRTVSTYTTNTDITRILGSSAASYTDTAERSKQNNRLTSVGSTGMTAENLLRDGGLESEDGWTNASTGSGSAAARTTITNEENRRHGTGGLNLYLPDGAGSGDAAAISRPVTLTAGETYTLSGYFSASSHLRWTSGARLEAVVQGGGAEQTVLLTDARPSSAIENGWQRVTATFTAPAASCRIAFRMSGCTGTAYLDDLQLEQAEAASTYNLLQNASFEFGDAGWNLQGGSAAAAETKFGAKAMTMQGSYNGILHVSQPVALNCSSDTTFLLSGWAQADYAAPNAALEFDGSTRYFGLIAEIFYVGVSEPEQQSVPFSWATADWQCAVGTIVPKESGKTIRRIIVYCAFDHNSGTARFDNLSLRQEPVQTYSYNADGNVTAATQTGTGTEKAGYTGTDLTSYTAANGAKYTYTYNAAHDVTSASVAGIKSTTTYNEAGNVIGSKLTSTEKNEQKYLESSAVATPDRNHTQSVTDVNGNTTSYGYNSLAEQLILTTDALGRETNYTYDANSRRTAMVYRHGVAAIDYGYENGRLATLDRKTFRSGATQHQIYSFGYNQWGQATSTSVGDRVLSTNDYAPRGGNLTQTTYANGVAVTYSYDLLDRLVEKSYHETGKPDLTIRYTYNAESQLARLRYEEDGETIGSYAFEYDSLGRLIRSTAMDENGSVTQRTEHLYDAFNRLSGQSWTLGAQTYSERYAYSDGEKGDGSLTSMTAATGDSLSFGYDALKRLNRVTVKNGSSVILNTAYAYRDVSWNRGSAQVEFRNVRLGSDSGMLLEGKKYSYDKAGNLVMISESTGDFNKLVEYAYDDQNQLVKESYYTPGNEKPYDVYDYSYDTAGNLLSVTKNGTVIQTYTYGDAQWHDLLTAVNGQAITYDASGNPLSYGGWSFGWQNGRQLKTASKTSDGKTETLEYSYDADGIRTSKTYTVETFTQVPDYTVTFQADGATVKTMTVEDGYTLKDSDYPAVPAKSGYTGEWVKYTSAVHSNVTVSATYTKDVVTYTVTFVADGVTVKTMTVEDGYTLKDFDYPTVPSKTGYNGMWKKYTSAIHKNVTVYAIYRALTTAKHTVKFVARLEVVKTMTVSDGYTLQSSDYPTVPPREGYRGTWERYSSPVYEDITINAVYHKLGDIIPTQPTDPDEIMSGGEGEPVEADAPAEDETVAPQGTHVTGTQTVTHEYLTLNGKVARETIKTNNSLTAVLDFVYDESGKPFALKYSTNGTSFQTYYYVLNLQGDVVKLIHYIPGFEYESVATYEYDAWGNVSSSGRLAEINPLRYRGYYYDNETGFYYLQSRYYDPANRRFINADGLISFDCGFSGLNMYSYCGNCPVACSDPNGASFISDLIEKAKDLLRYVLHAGNDLARMHGIDTAAVGAAVLEMEKDENGIYHARPDCWQQYFGYSFLYDYAFDAGTSMATDQFYFDYAGEQYAFWIWRGDYINLGAGAEAGIYYGGGPFWAVDTDLAMRMSMDVYYQGENIISYSDTTWWLTGFNPEYLNVSAGDMSVVYTIVFSDPGMFSAFCAANGKYWNCNPMNFSATYRFG